MIHQTFVRWAFNILFKFVNSLNKHLGLTIGNVRWFSWTLHESTYHYLNQCWHRSMSSYGVTRPQWVNMPLTQFELILIVHLCLVFLFLKLLKQRPVIVNFSWRLWKPKTIDIQWHEHNSIRCKKMLQQSTNSKTTYGSYWWWAKTKQNCFM